MDKIRNLAKDERGNSLIEFALIAPILASMVVGVIDVSSYYSAKLVLEQAAQRAIEKGMQAKKNVTLFESLTAEGAAAANVAPSAVTVKYWLECNGVNQNTSAATMTPDYEKKVCPPAIPAKPFARYVTIEIKKTFTPMFKVGWPGANADGSYNMVGASGIRVQ